MTRQVAIGAIIAFALTVLGLSLWQPGSAPSAPTPVPSTPPVVGPTVRDVRAGDLGVQVREVTRIHPRIIQGLVLEPTDAGPAPAP